MSQRILVLESDDRFATELRAGFTSLGADVEVVSDGATGLERVQQAKPDLILLSIELAGMNGFLVCNKIKKKADLKGIPLLVMSSAPNATDTFERHRELPTRADDYIKKPIAFDDLIDRVQRWVPLDVASANSRPPTVAAGGRDSVAPKKDVDAEIDAFADEAFDNLVSHEKRASAVDTDAHGVPGDDTTGVSSPPLAAAATAATEDVDFIELDDTEGLEFEEMGEEAPRPESARPGKRKSEKPGRNKAAAAAEASSSGADRAQVEELSRKLAAAESRAEEAEKAAQELRSVKSQRPQPAISSREFLDLREQLNTKDKELLDFKDQISAKEKELLDVRGKNLQFERSKADVEDKVFGLENTIGELKEKLTAAEGDKESAAKRAADAKERLDRIQVRVKQLEDELESAKAEGQAKLAALEERYATQTARNASSHASEVETLKQQADQALATEKKAREEELARLQIQYDDTASRMRAESEAKLGKLSEDHAIDLAQRVGELEQQAATQVAEVTARLHAQVEREQQKGAQEKEAALSSLRSELEREKNEAVQKSEEKHSRELVLIGRKLTETENRLDQAMQSAAEAQAKVDVLSMQTQRLEGKLAADGELLERARRAFSIGLSLLEDQKKDAAE